jgi:hypothetical protein
VLREEEEKERRRLLLLLDWVVKCAATPRLDCTLTKPRQKLLHVDNTTSDDTSMINIFLNGVCVVMPTNRMEERRHASAQLMMWVGWSAFSGSSSFGVMSQTSYASHSRALCYSTAYRFNVCIMMRSNRVCVVYKSCRCDVSSCWHQISFDGNIFPLSSLSY